jgi:ferrochelatase
MDKNIIELPWALRFPLARLLSRRRSRREARAAYGKLGFRSPLLDNTRAQAEALETELAARGFDAQVLVSMRYWGPSSREAAAALAAQAPDRLVLLPLYPQFSRTTTGSSFEDFRSALAKTAPHAPWARDAATVDSYPALDGFIRASAANIRAALAKAPPNTRLLLSAHGLPEKIIAAGDPYQRHCEQTAARVVAELGLPPAQWRICYQSQVGPLRWIGPSLDAALQEAAADRAGGVLVYPHAFVSEHVETLVELDIEYRHRAAALGIPWYGRATTVGIRAEFIAGLADLVETALEKTPTNRAMA